MTGEGAHIAQSPPAPRITASLAVQPENLPRHILSSSLDVCSGGLCRAGASVAEVDVFPLVRFQVTLVVSP